MKLDPKKTALLALDLQRGILSMVVGSEAAAIPNAIKAAGFARETGYIVIHVGLGLSEGHPEIPADSVLAGRLKDKSLFVKGSPSAEFHPAILRPGELVIHKQRISAFSENHLHVVLRAKGIENLILMGVATSGIVLSTLRRAFDLDFRCTVLKDACFDRDPEVHRVLMEKVFPTQATVVTVDEFLSGQGERI
jgi:nicotinamidase-related amidase